MDPVTLGSQPSTISWSFLIIGLFGGLAIFLYGLSKLSDGLKKSAGEGMRKILATLTTNRFMGLLTGAFVTMIIQSSSATLVMLVSFVRVGLLSFGQTLGVILGADIGTTFTAQLIAFQVDEYALALIAVGFMISFFSKGEAFKHIGETIFGFGLLFFGMKLMSEAMFPLRTYEPFIGFLKNLENPLLGLIAGTLFTALIQSSSAFIGIIIVLAQQGILPLEAGIPLMFGANLGTCITAGLSIIGANREAKKVALAHILFKTAGVLLFIFWIPWFAELVRYFSPHSGDDTLANLSKEVPRQIANAHTLFNVSLAFAFLPVTNLFVTLINRLLPDVKEVSALTPAETHLDDNSLLTPALAVDLARAEVARMAKILHRMLDAVIYPLLDNKPTPDFLYPQLTKVEGIKAREEKIDFLQQKVTEFLLKIERKPLSDQQSAEIFMLLSVSKYLENLGDLIEKNMLDLIAKKRSMRVEFSEEGKEEIRIMHQKALKQLTRLREALEEKNLKKAHRILHKEMKYLNMGSEFRKSHLQRLVERKENTVATHELHMDVMETLMRINYYVAEMADVLVKSLPEAD
jgi:phosphate:Na+ symporter